MSAFRALRNRDYRLYFTGQLVSMVGTWMQNVALAWMVHRLTGDPRWLGFVAAATQGPSFLLGLPGGAVADRVSPRLLTILTQVLLLLQALGMAWLALSPQPSVPILLALAVGMGIVTAFDLPARQVLVARVVSREELPNAVALNSALFHASRIVGPALAGLVLAWKGEAACFLVNALSFLAALLGLMLMRVQPGSGGRRAPLLEDMLEGARFCWRHAPLRDLMGLSALVVCLGMPFTALLPVFAKDILQAGPRGLGWIMGVSGVGATLAALALARRKESEGLERILVWSTLGFSLFLAAFAGSRWLPLSAILLGMVSFFLVTQNTGNNTLVQQHAPDALRGRITALYGMVFMGAMPLGALLGGFAARRMGAPWTLVMGAVGCALGAGLFAGMNRRQKLPQPD